MAKTVSHICILVWDIDEAIEKYKKILGVLSPELLAGAVKKQKRHAEGEYITAFFGTPGDGCDIQLLQPPDKDSPLYRRLEKYGEGVHHIAFSTGRMEDSYHALLQEGVAVNDHIVEESSAENEKDVRHYWVLPKYASGVLIEVIDDYKVVGGLLTSG